MTLNSILSKLCSATGMIINRHKSIFLVQNIDPSLQQNLSAIFNIKIENIDLGMKYLGFNLKLNNYKVNTWMWLLKKIEKDHELCFQMALSWWEAHFSNFCSSEHSSLLA
jgi:hypothetical protein